ncbi:uncharacterized protein LOC119641517 isoform X1 [Glossina fuscipes]|uniref:Uncharacterized protein LOC119641517 isoform X1 n=1 Tax=Glossina fuscipes TaxID=7396 RepID=A0A9C5ZAV8_9MUSC|nr:uncharacterized protein LOC119641517 isoform X1 [Glossina fuscipes]
MANFETYQVTEPALNTINNFIIIMNDLLEAYPGITIHAYRVSQDLLQKFFCKMAPGRRKRTRPVEDVMKLGTRLMKQQLEFWGGGSRTDKDYELIKNLNYKTPAQAEDEFLHYDLNGVPYKVAAKRLTLNEAEYFRLLTGYGIAQYIREQLKCQACLNDLTITKEEACSGIDGMLVANIQEHDEILANKNLEPEFPRLDVLNVFLEALGIYLEIIKFHMVERNIGKRTQATILKQLDFFKEKGSCRNGRSHRTNLLGSIIHLLLIEKNWIQKRVKNVSTFCSRGRPLAQSNPAIRSPPHIDEDSLHAKDQKACFLLHLHSSRFSSMRYFHRPMFEKPGRHLDVCYIPDVLSS